MIIRTASFIKSSTSLSECPVTSKPEFGFIGRSNVGKSSLINMITGRKKLAKISGNPGKTKTINHFLINNEWYLVDLPGYGYAGAPASMRKEWSDAVTRYILARENLVCMFVLLDPRIKPQRSDLAFMEFLGVRQVPFARIFTKGDKLSDTCIQKAISVYDKTMLEKWESLPPSFISSSVNRTGRENILGFIEECINNFSNGL